MTTDETTTTSLLRDAKRWKTTGDGQFRVRFSSFFLFFFRRIIIIIVVVCSVRSIRLSLSLSLSLSRALWGCSRDPAFLALALGIDGRARFSSFARVSQASNHSEAFESYTKAKARLERVLFSTSLDDADERTKHGTNNATSYPMDPIEASRVLLNRSICAHSLEKFDESFNDADMAKSILEGALEHEERNGTERSIRNELRFRLRKAYFRCAKAAEKTENFDGACEMYMHALKIASPNTKNSKTNTGHIFDAIAALVARDQVSIEFICDDYAKRISDDETPNPLTFSRDGKGLSLIRPESARMSKKRVRSLLFEYSVGEEKRVRDEWLKFTSLHFGFESNVFHGNSTRTMFTKTQRKSIARGFLSGIRARAYLRANNVTQAAKDVKAAVYMCKDVIAFGGAFHYERALCCDRLLLEENITRMEIAQGGEEGIGLENDNLIVDSQVACALFAKRAVETEEALLMKEKEEKEMPSCSKLRSHTVHVYQSYFEKMQSRLTDPIKAALRKGSSFALTFLDKDKWENQVPEYMRPKPKYFYYYEWMKDRIKEYYPSLPECVMDKLLSLDGAELDLLLQHPQAIRGQTEEFLQVLDQKGEKFLETYKTPQLSWEEVQALRVADAKKKKLLENHRSDDADSDADSEEDTDHAAIGASGDDGFTRAERLGAPVLPRLPPDQHREKEKIDDMKSTMAKESQKLLADTNKNASPPARKTSSSLDSMD